jgi:hypothetical protein
MFFGNKKNYDRKTVGHVFTEPVQIEGTTQKLFHKKCFSSQFTFLPAGDASVCSDKMATPGEKFCVLEYHTTKSVVTVQSAFRVLEYHTTNVQRAKYAKDPPTDKTIRAWYKQLQQ